MEAFESQAEEDFAALLTTLAEGDSIARMHAVSSLGKIGGMRSVEPLIQALDDSEEAIRTKAAEYLWMIGDDHATEQLIDSLRQSSRKARCCAMWALGRIGKQQAIGPLRGVLKNEMDAAVREHALEALEAIGTPEAIMGVIMCLDDTDAKVANTAWRILRHLLGDKAYERLHKALLSEREHAPTA